MRIFAKLLTGAAGLAMAAAASAPASAQSYPGYPQYGYSPQAYPQSYPQTYPQGYGYQQPYGTQNGGVIGAVLESLIGGNRYNTSDRTAVQQCATAAQARVASDYRSTGYGYSQGYNQGYGDPQGYGYNQYHGVRPAQVVGITSVQRKSSGVKVTGLIDSGRGFQRSGYGQGYANAYAGPGYAAQSADLKFNCRVDYRGYVTSVSISRNNNQAYRGY